MEILRHGKKFHLKRVSTYDISDISEVARLWYTILLKNHSLIGYVAVCISLSYSYSLTTFCWRVNVVSFLAGVFNFLVDGMMRAF